jgi:hypothetical protein
MPLPIAVATRPSPPLAVWLMRLTGGLLPILAVPRLVIYHSLLSIKNRTENRAHEWNEEKTGRLLDRKGQRRSTNYHLHHTEDASTTENGRRAATSTKTSATPNSSSVILLTPPLTTRATRQHTNLINLDHSSVSLLG